MRNKELYDVIVTIPQIDFVPANNVAWGIIGGAINAQTDLITKVQEMINAAINTLKTDNNLQ